MPSAIAIVFVATLPENEVRVAVLAIVSAGL